jgi:hypothetical protein
VLPPLVPNNSRPGPAVGVRELLASMRQHVPTPPTAQAAADGAGVMEPLVPNNSRPGPIEPSKLLAQMQRDHSPPRTAPAAAERFGVGSLAPLTTNTSRPANRTRAPDVPHYRTVPTKRPMPSPVPTAPEPDPLLALLRHLIADG